jgi:AcrR family transcriptional regulator
LNDKQPDCIPVTVARVEAVPRERADAARNRHRILAAAHDVIREQGPDGLTVAAVAARAGVGNATLIRRFGDKAGLIYALLDEHERELQDQVIRGEPPLGPGASPRRRLLSFLAALTELSLEHLDLLYASETAKPGARYRTGAYTAWHHHLALLLEQSDSAADASTGAHLLLAPLAAESLRELRARGRVDTLHSELRAVADAMLRRRLRQ